MVIAGVLVISGVAVVLLRQEGPLSPNPAEAYGPVVPLPAIFATSPLDQDFVARGQGLSQVSARFGTYGGNRACSLRFRVASGTLVMSERILRCADLPDNGFRVIARFPPRPDSDRATYHLHITAEPGSVEGVSLFGAPPIPGTTPARSGSVALADAAELRTSYGSSGTVLSHLGTILRRLGQYRPIWARPAAVVVVVVVGLGALVAAFGLSGRPAVAALLVMAGAKGLLWSVIVPPLVSPDEPGHFAYSQYLAERYSLPRPGSGAAPGYSPQLQRAIDVLHVNAADRGERPDYGLGANGPDRSQLDAHLSTRADGNNSAAGYSPIYYIPAALLYRLAGTSILTEVAVMRLWSASLGVLAVWLALLLGRRLFPSAEVAAMTLAVAVALQPMFSQQTGTLNNDALLIAGAFWCFLIALDLLGHQPSRRLMFAAGTALGLTVLAKPYGAALVIVMAVGWLVGRLRRTDSRWTGWLADVGLAGAGVICTYGVWVVVAAWLHRPSSPGLAESPSAGPKTLGAYLLSQYHDHFAALKLTWIDRFWGFLGPLTVPLPHWMYRSLHWATAGILLVIAIWFVTVAAKGILSRRSVGNHVRRAASAREVTILAATMCLVAVGSTLFVLHAAEFALFREAGRADLLQGRYLLMSLPAVLALPPLLLKGLWSRLPVGLMVGGMATAMLVLQVAAVAQAAAWWYA
jgi:hypothetical protein